MRSARLHALRSDAVWAIVEFAEHGPGGDVHGSSRGVSERRARRFASGCVTCRAGVRMMQMRNPVQIAIAVCAAAVLVACTKLEPAKHKTDGGAFGVDAGSGGIMNMSGAGGMNAPGSGGSAAPNGSGGAPTGPGSSDAAQQNVSKPGADGGLETGHDAGPGSSSCGSGMKTCGKSCILQSRCCTDDECPAGGSCKSGACECPSGTHACGSSCASDSSKDSCGQGCDPCKAPTGGDVDCGAGKCQPSCPANQRACAGTCIADTMACTGQCPSDTHDCSGVCIDNTSTNGCGTSSCDACSTPQYGQATCDGNGCGFMCDSSHQACDGACIGQGDCCHSTDCQSSAMCASDHQCSCAGSLKQCGSGSAATCVNGNCCGAGDCQSSATCASNVCDCTGNQVKCGSGTGVTCWPSGSCCGDGDCSTGYSCVSHSCKSWCGQQTRPSGVVASDYQCADFETGLPSAWTNASASGGSAAVSKTRANSLPQSFLSTVTSTDGSSGQLTWDAVGANAVTGATISAQIFPTLFASNLPAFSGEIDLLCFQDGTNFQTCLSYTLGGTLYPLQAANITNYTGIYLRYALTGSAALLYDCPLTGNLTFNAWNAVVFSATSTATVTVNGADVNGSGCSGGLGGATAPTLRVGLRTRGTVSSGWNAYFDNVVASVTR
jgi:hypothetical protein